MDACQRVVRSVELCQAVCHQFVIRSVAKQALLDAPITLLPARIRRAPLVTGQLSVGGSAQVTASLRTRCSAFY